MLGLRLTGALPGNAESTVASSKLRQIVARQFVILTEAPSDKLQAPSYKLQAPSHKPPVP